MSAEYQGVVCSACGARVSPSESAVCPQCGAAAKMHLLYSGNEITPKGDLSWMHERREIIRERPWIRWALLVFDLASLIGGFFLAQWTGAAIGLTLVIAGELLAPKTILVITRTHGKSL